MEKLISKPLLNHFLGQDVVILMVMEI